MELAEKGNVYYDQNCQPKVQYGLTISKEWLQKLVNADASKIVNVFAPGDYLRVVDNEIDVNKAIRIKSFVRNVLDPYDYTLTISDMTSDTNITTRVISELINIDKALTINNLKDPADRKSTRLNSSHANISYAVFCLYKKQIFTKYYVTSQSLYDIPCS